MKRTALLLLIGLAAAAWLGWDTISAMRMANDISDQQQAVNLYEERHGSMTTEQRYGYLDNAYQACHYLDSNPSLPDLWLAMTDSGISSDAAATTIEAAARYLCTEHSYLYG